MASGSTPTQDPDELHEAVQAILRGSRPMPRSAIFDYESFGDLRLDEHEWLATVSKIANGIRLYGPAFAARAEYIGTDNDD
jgi:hypothetical protein